MVSILSKTGCRIRESIQFELKQVYKEGEIIIWKKRIAEMLDYLTKKKECPTYAPAKIGSFEAFGCSFNAPDSQSF